VHAGGSGHQQARQHHRPLVADRNLCIPAVRLDPARRHVVRPRLGFRCLVTRLRCLSLFFRQPRVFPIFLDDSRTFGINSMFVVSATLPVRLSASHLLLAPSKPSAKFFTINTCKTVSKQSTLTPFRINTSEKHPGYTPLPLLPLLKYCLNSHPSVGACPDPLG